MLKFARLFLSACLCLTQAAPLVARERTPVSMPQHRKGADLSANPIEPMKPKEEKDEKPRAGWNGFYGGLNVGGASGRDADQ